MGLSDSRLRTARGYGFPLAATACYCMRLLGRASQVPWLICPCALPPFTPASPAVVCAHCSTAGCRLHPYPADWPLASRNEAEPGSLALRLAGLPFEASPGGLLRLALD